MNSDEYRTIKSGGEGYYTEKRSKFLAFAHHVSTVDEIKELLAGYRKKYYDARHVCYAYMLGPERSEFRANDDGEPSSTAGKPILGQIKTRQVEELITYSFAYPQMNDVMRIVKEMNPRIVSQTYDNTCEIKLSIRKSEAEQLRSKLAKISFD